MNATVKLAAVCLAILCGLAQMSPASAEYPERNITVIVPFAAGGATDVIARTIAADVTARLGKSVVIENRAGAGTVLGTTAVVRAAPDGYTLLFHSGALAIDLSFKKNLGYDVRKDLVPITKAAWGPFAVLVHKDLPVKTLAELVAYAKQRPEKLNLGSAGIGTMGHLTASYLAARAEIKLTHIPFRGSGPALTAIMGGQLDVLLDPPFTALPAIQSGNARALAVTGEKRSPLLPDVATVAELGYRGFAAGHWGGFFAPAGTPDAIIQRLNKEFVTALQDPRVRDVLRGQGLEIIGNTPAEFRKEIEQEIELWAKVIRDAGITVQQ
jgi:tripartite-type tricarboxylate transporter receptor subunit TctC